MLQLLTVLKTAELISVTVTFSFSESLKLEGFMQVQPVRWDSNAALCTSSCSCHLHMPEEPTSSQTAL